MKKALDILNELDNKDIWVLLELGLEHTNINGAIKELEEASLNRREWYQKGYNEAMKPKTCEGCNRNRTSLGYCSMIEE